MLSYEETQAIVAYIFNSDFLDFIQCLNETDVEYLLVGGYATIIYGYNRTTGDMDIWVNRTKKNYARLKSAFTKFQMPIFDMTESTFLNDDSIDVYTFGRPPVTIDIIVKLKGLDFSDVWNSREEKKLDENLFVKVIHLNHLIMAKKASNRPKDQDDIQHLEGK